MLSKKAKLKGKGLVGMTKKEFQIKHNISDEMMKTLEWLMKEYKGQEIKVVDTKKGLPVEHGKQS